MPLVRAICLQINVTLWTHCKPCCLSWRTVYSHLPLKCWHESYTQVETSVWVASSDVLHITLKALSTCYCDIPPKAHPMYGQSTDRGCGWMAGVYLASQTICTCLCWLVHTGAFTATQTLVVSIAFKWITFLHLIISLNWRTGPVLH